MPLPPLMGQGLPLLGHFPYIHGLGVDSFAFFMEGYRQHGRVFAVRDMKDTFAVLLGPEANRFVLERETPHLSWGAAYGDEGSRVMGPTAMPLLDGEEQRRRRAPMMSAFRHQNITAFGDAMVELARAQTAGWKEGRPVDLIGEMSELTFRVACGFLLGVEIGEDYPRFRELYKKMFTPVGLALQAAGLPYMQRYRDGLRRLSARWIADRRAHPRDDIISRLLEAGLDDEDVISQVLVLMFAGHDTTKLSLTWTLALLLRHPEYLARVLAEQDEVLGDGPIDAEATRKLPVLERAIREAHRLYPPASLLRRGVLEGFELGGYTIPKGWKVMYLPRVSHHLPDVFKDPERFDPDRFAPPREEHKQPYAMVEFGGGYRTCIGKELAMFEAKVVLSYLLRTFRFELAPGQRLDVANSGAMTSPRHGVKVFAKPTGRRVPLARAA
ncbi:cytochrome P450 [Archangium violaceum]|uniref:cytochrome P450 n=1 Tax=Archangium violaceum TaxID=83451 RepID=UPI00193AF6BF|nr:cytochrome P450 [Archangium violaceum]QRK11448.1 cytochrome P450 [Archangium violaceum]